MQTSSREMDKAYNPAIVESQWYDWWDNHGHFTPSSDEGQEPYAIIMPPPNVTGELHMGHALFVTVEDILVRWQRMRGRPTLWLPGADHAGIAGQWVVEKELADEGLTRQDLGRERFLERVWQWMDQYRGRIREQLRILGASCDWSRFAFTMDPGPARAVRTAFKMLYDKGLIYRGERMINWCPRCMTALSDLEVNHEEIASHIWTLRYPIDGTDRYIEVATTRPETMLGDTGVAVHPADERYRDLVGKTATLPIIGRTLPIVADEAVDAAFGTGAVKVTPAHDPNDFEIGQRHDLPAINIMNLDATLNEQAGPFAGQSREEARRNVVARLEEDGYLAHIEDHVHSVGRCDRCNTIVEPLISKQWFVKMEPLNQPAIEAVANGTVRFFPDRFKGQYLNWVENEHDWCISRQLWWGHRIPLWHCSGCGEVTASVEESLERCERCGDTEIAQDPDVLDTWFSSGLWPFSTLGWPDDGSRLGGTIGGEVSCRGGGTVTHRDLTPDQSGPARTRPDLPPDPSDQTEYLRRFYPSSVMETGYDIIFKWVHRMIFFGLEFMHEAPFPQVLLHGQVRDAVGQRMSKTKGNGIDPTIVTAEYGSDALRLALVTAGTMGADLKLGLERVESMRNFANKIWNATRYVLRATEGHDIATAPDGTVAPPDPGATTLADRWILSRLAAATQEVTDQMERFGLNEAGRRLYDFLWSEYCDWYIESTKVALGGDDEQAAAAARQTLVYALERSLRLLHPFMPFVTEELWHYLPLRGPVPVSTGADLSSRDLPGGFGLGRRQSNCRTARPNPPPPDQTPHRSGAALIVAPWPEAGERDGEAERDYGLLIEVVRTVRNARAENNVPSARLVSAEISAGPAAGALRDQQEIISRLARIDPKGLVIAEALTEPPDQAVSVVIGSGVQMYLPLAGLMDLDEERKRLEADIAATVAEAGRARARLENSQFTERAPAHVVEGARARLAAAEEKTRLLEERLRSLR